MIWDSIAIIDWLNCTQVISKTSAIKTVSSAKHTNLAHQNYNWHCRIGFHSLMQTTKSVCTYGDYHSNLPKCSSGLAESSRLVMEISSWLLLPPSLGSPEERFRLLLMEESSGEWGTVSSFELGLTVMLVYLRMGLAWEDKGVGSLWLVPIRSGET